MDLSDQQNRITLHEAGHLHIGRKYGFALECFNAERVEISATEYGQSWAFWFTLDNGDYVPRQHIEMSLAGMAAVALFDSATQTDLDGSRNDLGEIDNIMSGRGAQFGEGIDPYDFDISRGRDVYNRAMSLHSPFTDADKPELIRLFNITKLMVLSDSRFSAPTYSFQIPLQNSDFD